MASRVGRVNGMDKYAEALMQAMDDTDTSSTRVAEVARVGRNNVAHWRAGRRPIPAEHALAIAALLGVAPERISKAYDQKLRTDSARQVMGLHSPRSGTCPEGHVTLDRLPSFGRLDGPNRIWLPEFMVRRELGLTTIENVRWAVQPSRAMEPEIRRHALALVDVAVCRQEHVLDGGIYAYTLWGRPDIRRIAIRRNVWLLIGNDKDAERMEVQEADLPNLTILGAIAGCL